MKKSYKKVFKATNAVEAAAPASVWGKGIPGKFGASTNSVITAREYDREVRAMRGAANG